MTEKDQKDIFERWLSQCEALIFKVVRAYAADSMDQDDLFQEITIQVWRSIPSFRHESAVTTWIYRISLNTAIKWITKEKKRSRPEPIEHVQHLLHESGAKTDERLDWLYHEIHQLDEIDRSLTLLMLDNFSYKEMAAMLGITETNVGVKINRIKKQLISKSEKYIHHGI